MRRLLPAFALGLLVLELVSVSGHAQILPRPMLGLPPTLKGVRVPKPVGIEQFMKDEAAAIALGKALFWDMQTGSDGQVACATCHFHAGADSRAVNQLNAGADHFFSAGGPNHKLVAGDFPLRKLADPIDRNSPVLADHDDVVGSQGVHAAMFHDIVPGGARDDMDASTLDPLGFSVGGLNVRRVTGRNTPSAINAVFNVRNFWDGRAARRFNGRNPFGEADVNARVLKVNDLGELEAVRVSLDMASTASQAVGPPLSDVEMSAGGRTFMKLGKKLLSLQPLANQEVKADDSVLGPYAVAGGKGLSTTYGDLIRAAFHETWWNSNQLVDGALNPIPGGVLTPETAGSAEDTRRARGGRDGFDGTGKTVTLGASAPTDGSTLPTDQYTLMESNFSLFWGLAIAAYEATLVSDDAPYDQYREGNDHALTKQQLFGLRVFMGFDGGTCINCHSGPEFTGAGLRTRFDVVEVEGMAERMVMADGKVAAYDGGFYNIGVRPTAEDLGLGANDPFGNPLSLARREQAAPGSVPDIWVFPPISATERVNADGAFKTPSLRNIELTGPYFHNGGTASLEDVLEFYMRGGDFHDQNLSDLDFDISRMRGLIGHPARQIALLDFLRALTDERVRWYRAPFDHPELVVANGAVGNEVSVLQDLRTAGPAADATIRLPATGRSGASTPLKPFLNLPVFNATTLPAPNPIQAEMALFATDSVTITSRMDLEGDVWCNGGVRIASRAGHHMQGDVTAGGPIVVNGDSLRMTGSMTARGPIQLPELTFMDGFAAANADYFAPLAMPALPATPVLPLLQSSVTVPDYGMITLTPGRYGTLLVGAGGWVVLQPGTYVFSRISLGIGAFLQYDPDGQVDMPIGPQGEMPIGPLERVIVHVDNIDIARGAIVSQGDVRLSTHLRMYVRASSSVVKLSPESYFHGTLIAPSARFVMLNGSTLEGAVYSRTAEVAETAMYRSHILAELPPIPGGGFGGLTAGPTNPDDVPAAPSSLGLAFELGQNSPNPFRPSTTIRFSLPAARNVELRVFDVTGRAVRTLAKGPLGPGVHTLQWAGDDDRGGHLASGVYFYRLTAGHDQAQRKLVLID